MRFTEKGKPGEPLEKAVLLEDMGLKGDRKCKKGEDQQLSVLSAEVREWMNVQEVQGLCFRRYSENLSLSGFPLEQSKMGDRICVGDCVLIVNGRKHCFSECERIRNGLPCKLAGSARYAAVERGGVVRLGDPVCWAVERSMDEGKLNHFDETGNAVMVDVSAKNDTVRIAVAGGRIVMKPETLTLILSGTAKKGDVLGVARIAGIMATKRTADLIPLCHPLMLDNSSIEFNIDEVENAVEAVCTVKTTGKTGVEMEALTGASTALLTIYDMCKAVDRAMVISDLCLWQKSGGKSGEFRCSGKGSANGLKNEKK